MAQPGEEARKQLHIRTLMANASEGYVIVGDDSRVRLFNEVAEEFLGISRGDVVGKDMASIGVPELVDLVRELVSQGGDAPIVPVVVNVNNRVLSCKAVPFDSGSQAGVAIVMRDDSELVSQQERAEAILAGAGDGLLVFAPDSRVTYANPAAVEMLGDKVREAIGQHVSMGELLGQVLPDEDSVEPCWDIRSCNVLDCPQYGSEDLRCWLRCGTPGPDGTPVPYRDKAAACVTCEVFRKNSPILGEPGSNDVAEVMIEVPEHRVLEVRTNPVIDRAGRYIGCVSTLHDVTAAREIAVMKNEFVSMVSHELRTPLTSIKGYVDLIVDGEAGEINDIQREFLQIVQENSDRLVELINDLLDISRMESGRVHLKLEPLELPEIVQGVLDTFRTYADQSNVELSAKVGDDLPRVAGDRDRVGQVMMNLVSNAIKYSPGGGAATIGVGRDGDLVVISVSDSGIGISEEDQAQLFTKFFRVDSTLTREIGGTGLGLSICKTVVELMGGSIWVESVAGEGSTFSFSLPVAPDELVRTPSVEAPLVVGGTVLVVDHDPEIADLIEKYLQKRGYDVVKAHSAKEALAVAETAKPRLITLDVMLDDADGFELLQEFKDHPATRDVPVVVLSIVCDEGKSLRHGAADYLEKPIDHARLVKVVDELVGSKDSPVVLVVDDDRHIVDTLSTMLRAKGFAVQCAYDGAEALQAVEKRQPDLILLDLQMPVMDGYEVIQEIKSHDATREIPIVVMTAHRIDEKHIDIVKLAAEQVSKPFLPEHLVESIERFLGKEE
ncbi:MAG: response regulator [Actinomycetota bacterium]|nr:response regulator [Actinomycetota bacterium]